MAYIYYKFCIKPFGSMVHTFPAVLFKFHSEKVLIKKKKNSFNILKIPPMYTNLCIRRQRTRDRLEHSENHLHGRKPPK